MHKEIIETWQIHNRINSYLLDTIENENYLNDLSTAKGRNVRNQFMHMHNVRLMWIKEALPELLPNLEKLEDDNLSIEKLKINIIASGIAIEKLLKFGLENNRIKGFKPHPTAFLGYLISHESHHRGQIVLILKECGHSISKKAGFGLWQWGTR
ncbi:DinB family protein [Winogradskyella haliclonae]|uniref:Damage-inducible protein DinB n=1 Tax=Winogradskyella haliclonae TaxID=2048558 RepID=A0ABQ2BZJ6_9FLAO|nr:DinB family protein [Winogradskyella haliclonae]GGI56967.1 hypothetical protein GCM10011444_12760 [Winogradskyella haliclonae]